MATGSQNKIYQNMTFRPLHIRDTFQFLRGNVAPFTVVGGETGTAEVTGPNSNPGASPDVPFVIGVYSAMAEAAQPGNIRAVDSELLFNYPGSTAIEVNPTGTDGQPVTPNTAASNIAAIRGAITVAGTYTSPNPTSSFPSKSVTTTITAGYLYGVQGKINLAGTMNNGSGFTASLFGQMDTSAATATITSGYVSALHLDMGATSSLSSGSSAFINAETITNTCATLKMNSVIKVIANAAYLFDLSESNLTGNWIVGTTASTAAGTLKVLVNGAVRYIQLYSAEA